MAKWLEYPHVMQEFGCSNPIQVPVLGILDGGLGGGVGALVYNIYKIK